MTLRPISPRPAMLFLLLCLSGAKLPAVAAEPPESAPRLDAAAKMRLIEEIATALETMYVDADAGRRLATEIRRRSLDRAYEGVQTASQFAARMTRELQELGKDQHLAVVEESQQGATVQRVERRAGDGAEGARGPRIVRHHGGTAGPEAERWKRSNYGVARAERLEGNVGYLRVTGFPPGEGSKNALAGGMDFLAGTDSLIVDVRDCPGGVPDTVNLLASYFFGPEPIELLSRYNRHTDETEKDFTLRELPGARREDTDLQILTSENTGSACESFAYILQQHGRARVVGARTTGAGHLAVRVPIGSGLVMAVSVGRPIHPRTGRSWERTGVEPDIAMASGAALRAAHEQALSKLLERAGDPTQKRRLSWALERVRAEGKSPVSAKSLQDYAGSYGERAVVLETGNLSYRGPGTRRWPLSLVTKDIFTLDEDARVAFERNAAGEVAALSIARVDGSSERFAKSSGGEFPGSRPSEPASLARAESKPQAKSSDSAAALPDTPAGRRTAAFFEALRTREPERRRELIAANWTDAALKEMPAAGRAQRLAEIASNHPGLEPRRVVSSEAARIVVVAQDANGETLEVTVQIEPSPPHKIVGVRLEQAEPDAPPREEPKGTDEEVARALEDYLSGLAARDEFSGVVLLAKDGKPFFAKAYGFADRQKRLPNTLATRFNIGSIDKSFTQIAIRKLARENKLALTDAIRKHLPDYPGPGAEEITIEQLITQTSGLGDIFGERYASLPKERLQKLADFLPLFVDKPLLFEPGKGRSYSNSGYIVLGLIIEKASGMDYHDYVRKYVFDPAGMQDSGPIAPNAVAENRAIGYTRGDGGASVERARRPNTSTLPGRSSSAGGGYSTAPNLLKFDLALRKGILRSPEFEGAGGLGIAGGSPGVNAVLEMTSAHTVIVLCNDDPPSAERVAQKVRGWLPR